MLIITALYAGVLGLLLLILALRVAVLRMREQVALGVADNRRLERRVRAHGNLTENAPMALILLLLLELMATAPLLLHSLGGSFVLGRVLHAWGLSVRSGPSWQRLSGVLLSWTSMLVMAIMLLVESAARLWAQGV
jgi:uncharacterized membrane protein YecN with MAPEG domain